MRLQGTFKAYRNEKTVGFLRLNVEKMLFLNNAVVMDSGKGFWIAKPQKKNKDKYEDIYFFNKEVTEAILEQVGDGTRDVEIYVAMGSTEPEDSRYVTTDDLVDTDESFPF